MYGETLGDMQEHSCNNRYGPISVLSAEETVTGKSDAEFKIE